MKRFSTDKQSLNWQRFGLRILPFRSIAAEQRAFVARGWLEGFEAKEMLTYRHSSFWVDTSVCIAAHDRTGEERLVRYCARPPLASERLRKAGSEMVYRCAKQHSEPGSNSHDKRGNKVDEITVRPL